MKKLWLIIFLVAFCGSALAQNCNINIGGNRYVSCGGSIPVIVATRVLLAQASVDGSASAVTLYTVPAGADGVYRMSAGVVPRTLSSSAWNVNADITFPSGTHIPAQVAQAANVNSGAIASAPLVYLFYLHAGDVISCGTATASGSNTGGTFDVSWSVERVF